MSTSARRKRAKAGILAQPAGTEDMHPVDPKGRKPGQRSLATVLARYVLDARARNFSPKTVKKMELGLRLFDGFKGGIVDVRRVQGDDLRRFIVDLRERTLWPGMRQARERRLADASLRTYSQAVKVLWGWLLKEKIIRKNPMQDVALPKIGRKLPRTLTEAEAMSVMAAADSPRSRLLIYLFLDGGPRLCEVTGDGTHPGIYMQHIDFEKGTIRICGKFQVENTAYFGPETMEVMREYCQHDRPKPTGPDKLLLNEDGSPMKAARVQKVLGQIGRKAGLKLRLSPHKLRHTKAALCIKYGSNVEYQRRELGHRHISTTQVYLFVYDDDLIRAHRSYSPVTNLLKQVREGSRGAQSTGEKKQEEPAADSRAPALDRDRPRLGGGPGGPFCRGIQGLCRPSGTTTDR